MGLDLAEFSERTAALFDALAVVTGTLHVDHVVRLIEHKHLDVSNIDDALLFSGCYLSTNHRTLNIAHRP
jgi:hypothetical protein